MLSAICISCHPLIYFFTFLYYTDVGSLFFAMVSLTTHVYHYHLSSAMFSLIALTFRQTNIIIVAYEIGLTIIEEFRLKAQQSHILHIYTSRPSDTIDTKEYLTVLWNYGRIEIKFLLTLIQSIIWKCRYNLCVIILFVIFFIKNNYSMTLGHQEHHQIVLHLAQMQYYAIYTSFFVSAHLVSLVDLFILSPIYV
jgi:alpha-1,2-glucosyltransferase